MEILNSLGVNFTAVIWHAVNFLILLWVLQRYLFKPILAMLDQRATRIRESMENAESVRAETARLEAESKDILDHARQEGQQLMAQANRNAERIMTEARQAAQVEGERLVERARAELARERTQAFEELRVQIGELAIQAASQVVRRSLDANQHRELLREVVSAAAPANGGAQRAAQLPPQPAADSDRTIQIPAPPDADSDRTIQIPRAGDDDDRTMQMPPEGTR
jgi:F-type H+-transporting ATPase subunit b